MVSKPTKEHESLYAVWKLIWIDDAPHVEGGPLRLDRFAQALDATYGFGARFQAEEDAKKTAQT